MQNLKKNDTDELIYKTEGDHPDSENKHIVTKGEKGEGINWEFGINICTLLGIKQRNNKDLQYSTGNSIQNSVIT